MLLNRGLPLEKDQAIVTLLEVTEMEDLPPHLLAPKVHWERASGYFALEIVDEAERELRALPKEDHGTKRKDVAFGHPTRTGKLSSRGRARGLRLNFDEADWCFDAYATRRCDSIESQKFCSKV